MLRHWDRVGTAVKRDEQTKFDHFFLKKKKRRRRRKTKWMIDDIYVYWILNVNYIARQKPSRLWKGLL